MQAVLLPKLQLSISLLSSEVLHNRDSAGVWEGEQLCLVRGVNATQDEGVVYRVDIAV